MIPRLFSVTGRYFAASSAASILTCLLAASPVKCTAGATIDSAFQSPELAEPSVPQRLLRLPDDSLLTYWNFNRFNGQNAGLILKFKPDGTLDTTFRFTGPYLHVMALAPAPGGKFIVAVRRQDRRGATFPILRLNADGSVDGSFNAGSGANREVYGLAVQPDGRIVVGGVFETFNEQPRQGIVRLLPDGGLDSSFAGVQFQPDETSTTFYGIRSQIILQPDGKILFGGSFSGLNGMSRNGVARLNTDGSVDSTFVPTAARTGTGGHRPILAIELQPDGKILAAGRFMPGPGTFITPLVRMSAEGAAEVYFPGRPALSSGPSTVRPFGTALKLLANGDIIVAGDRLYFYSADGAERSRSQTVTVSGVAFGLESASDGKFLLAGDRSATVNAGVQRFSADGIRDTGFNLGDFQREVLPRMVVPRADGDIWLTGFSLRSVNGVARGGVARLNHNGTLDSSEPPFRTFADGISVQADGRYVLFGASVYDRFNTDDTEDQMFAYDTGSAPFNAVQPGVDGKHFMLANDATAVVYDTVIRQIRDDGFIDPSFQFGIKFSEAATSEAGYIIYTGENRLMATYPDGAFLFRYFDKSGNYRLGRFKADGSLDSSFQTSSVPALQKTESFQNVVGPSGSIDQHLVIFAFANVLTDVLLLPDGKWLAVGMFKQFNGVAAPGIVRLTADGSVDPSFDAGSGAEWLSPPADQTQIPRIDAVERLADGKLLITGDFESFNGVAAPGIALLNPNGSVDSTFVSPVVRQGEITASFDDLASSPISQLISEPGGTILLRGNYAPASGGSARALIRLVLSGTQTRPLNISTRLNVQTGENVLIGGFIITGNSPKKVIVRALGTSLTQAGISGALADPTLDLLGPDGVIAANDNWKDSQRAEIESSGVPPQSDSESAIVRTLAPGAYTAVLRGKNGGTGVGLVELYDLDQAAAANLANISTRGFVQTGENVMIGGFILGGGGGTNILVRALGPSLGDSGVAGALQDPMLELRNSDGNLVAENDDWKTTQEAAIAATTIPPKRDAEAALLVSLPAGAYTATVRGKNNATGVGLVEVYNVQ